MPSNGYINLEMLLDEELLTLGVNDADKIIPCSTLVTYGPDVGDRKSDYN